MKKSLIAGILLAVLLYAVPCIADENETVTCSAPRFMQSCGLMNFSVICPEKDIEEFILNGWKDFDEQIDISSFNIREADIGDLYWSISQQNPLYYYLGDTFSYSRKNGVVTVLYPTYAVTDKAEINAFYEKIDAATEEILYYIDDDMSDFEKIMTVHDYMVLNYEYDENLLIYDISIMFRKTGVCQSYSYAFMHVMDTLGIECAFVASEEMLHGWNLVKVDDDWYHIDLTWDDPTKDRFGQIAHTYALLSTEKLTSLSKPHYGFDLGDYVADSTVFDNEKWRGGVSAVVHAAGKTYWFEGRDLVCSDESVIHEDIIDGTYWPIGGGYGLPGVYAGLAVRGELLYYNSDDKIYSYHTGTGEKKVVYEGEAICGLFIDKNTLYYTVYDSSADERFVKGGQLHLGDVNIKESHRDGKKIYTTVCYTGEEPLRVYGFNGNDFCMKNYNEKGIFTTEIEIDNKTELFIWDAKMKPLTAKRTIE